MTTTRRFNPWHRLRDLGDAWKLEWSDHLPPWRYGHTNFTTGVITLARGMSFEERRCTIAHEVEHVLRGPASRCDRLREEARVDRTVSRLLMPSVREVADELVYNHGDYEATAEGLWVDPWMLEIRLGTLLPHEVEYLAERKRDIIVVAPD